jgi:hypothetical protein
MVNERTNAKFKLIDFNNKTTKSIKQEKIIYKNRKKSIKDKYNEDIKQYKNLFKTKKIQKLALKAAKYKLKILKKGNLRSLLLSSNVKQTKDTLKTFYIRYKTKRKIYNKVYDSKIAELVKEVVKESRKIRWLACAMGLIIPGLAEFILFKQRLKGIIMLAITAVFYGIFVPFSFGLM